MKTLYSMPTTTPSTSSDIYWNEKRDLAWHRGFEIRVLHYSLADQRELRFHVRSHGNLCFIALHKARLKGDIELQIRGKTTHLLRDGAMSAMTAVDYIPWEIHRITNTTARLAATKAYLQSAEVTLHETLHWPPFNGASVKLVFPTGEITRPKAKL